MKKLNIVSTISENDILDALSELTDNEKARFAIKLGENGDITYELILLNEIIKIINKMYPPNTKDDIEMGELSYSLKNVIKPLLEKIICIERNTRLRQADSIF